MAAAVLTHSEALLLNNLKKKQTMPKSLGFQTPYRIPTFCWLVASPLNLPALSHRLISIRNSFFFFFLEGAHHEGPTTSSVLLRAESMPCPENGHGRWWRCWKKTENHAKGSTEITMGDAMSGTDEFGNFILANEGDAGAEWDNELR